MQEWRHKKLSEQPSLSFHVSTSNRPEGQIYALFIALEPQPSEFCATLNIVETFFEQGRMDDGKVEVPLGSRRHTTLPLADPPKARNPKPTYLGALQNSGFRFPCMPSNECIRVFCNKTRFCSGKGTVVRSSDVSRQDPFSTQEAHILQWELLKTGDPQDPANLVGLHKDGRRPLFKS